MNTKITKIQLLQSAPIPKALLALGLPTMIGMMINALYNLVDAYFVGGLGTSQMGAISIAFPLGQVVVGLGLLFGNGAASYLSRLLGRKENVLANKVASTALVCSVSVGLLMIIISLLFLRPILIMLGATESILPYAIPYAAIYISCSLFNVFNVTMNNIVTSEGAAKTTMLALLTGAVLNIILDPIFIYTMNLGIVGAAVATGLSQFISTLIYLTYILRKRSVFHFSIRECCWSKNIFAEIMKIGIPTLIFQLLTSLSISLINMQAKPYGDPAIAALGAVTRIVSMGSLMVFGFIKGFQPIAGFTYGAKQYDRLKEAIRTSILWSTCFCVLFGLLMILFSSQMISAFTKNDAALIRIGQESLYINGFSFFFFGFSTVYSSLFLALGKAKRGFILGACRQGICFLPVIFLLPLLFGIHGIILAQPAADLLASVITLIMARQFHLS